MESQSSVFSEAGPVRWSRSAAVLSTLFLLGTLVAGNCQAQKYTVSKLQTLAGGTYTSVVRMNKAGEVVGSADDSTGDTLAVAWNGTTPSVVYADVVLPPSPGYAVATDINNAGIVVGNYQDVEYGAFAIGPNVSAFADPLLHDVLIEAINDANVTVGNVLEHPVIWFGLNLELKASGALLTTADNFGAYALPSRINDAGVIVGTQYDALPDSSNTYPVAVRWEPDPITHSPGASVKALAGLGGMDSGANAVNANDWVVGWATLPNKLQHAVLWEGNNRPLDLGTLGGKESSADAVNVEGDIAGEAQTASGAWHAVLWTHLDFKPTDLNLEISPTLAKQFTLTSAADTNDRCMVLANGVDNKTGAGESFVLSLTDQSKCNEP